MAVQNALGQACRARTVDDVEIVQRINRHRERRIVRRREPGLEILPTGTFEVVGDTTARNELGEAILVRFDQRPVLIGQEQHLGIAIVEHLFERVGGGHGRERHDTGAGAQRAHEGLDIFDGVSGQDRDLAALADTHAGQGTGDLVQALVEIAPRPGGAFADNRSLVRKVPGVLRDANRDRQEFRKVVLRRLRNQRSIRTHFFGSTFSTGPPAFFQALSPPSR